MQSTTVDLGDRSYPIIVTANRLDRLGRLIRKFAGGERLFVLIDAQVFALYGKQILRVVSESNVQFSVIAIPQGERGKSATEAARLYDLLLAQDISRNDVILACGGGVTTDLAGYVASTILRGVRWGAVPTTLLGMVDAAIGGKTAINHRSGKNLIGTFWHPCFVYSDLNFLMTLPDRELIAGLGEITKYAGIAGGEMLTMLSAYVDQRKLLDLRTLKRLVERSVEIKARIVGADEREQGERITLNFGHTFAHAMEKSLGYGRLRHGEAVLLGIRAALYLGERQGIGNMRMLSGYTEIVDALLHLVPRKSIDESAVLDAMDFDKKRKGGRMRFVLLECPGAPKVVEDVTTQNIRWSLNQALRQYESGGELYVKDTGR